MKITNRYNGTDISKPITNWSTPFGINKTYNSNARDTLSDRYLAAVFAGYLRWYLVAVLVPDTLL